MVLQEDKVVVGYFQSFTLSCDHRVIDGAVAAEFAKAPLSVFFR
jgi:pyruvate/2-oxoglutarate dehydrogenase complex dihydrolipoamide acyltransferase (E2) component